MTSNTPRLCGLFVALSIALTSAFGDAQTSQDISTSSGVFISRPSNPPVRRRARQSQKGSGVRQSEPGRRPDDSLSQTAPPKTAAPESAGRGSKKEENEEAAAYSPNDLSDEVEDALFLGNAARDSEPPRFGEAERAYKLALKLDPDDPRPHVGLANIYYDQRQFEKAAGEYRAALNVQEMNKEKAAVVAARAAAKASTPAPRSKGAKSIKGARTRGGSVKHYALAPPSIKLSSPEGRWRFYLASALLQSGRAEEVEAQLRYVRPDGEGDASWYATLAAYLVARRRYEEAAPLAEKAASLAPDAAAYKELSETIRARRAEVESRSEATAKELEGTTWLISSRRDVSGACELRRGELRCQYILKFYYPFSHGRWRTEGDLLHIYDDRGPGFHCVGAVKGNQIDFDCPTSTDIFPERRISWVKK